MAGIRTYWCGVEGGGRGVFIGVPRRVLVGLPPGVGDRRGEFGEVVEEGCDAADDRLGLVPESLNDGDDVRVFPR